MREIEQNADDDRVRLDKWLWAARFYKTRSLASEAIAGGKVQVNGDRAKRARPLQVGDEVRVRQGPYDHLVVVRALSARRGPATAAAELYEARPERMTEPGLTLSWPAYLGAVPWVASKTAWPVW